MYIKDIIKTKRIEKQLTMKQLADLVGVSEATISRWESGEISNMRREGIKNLSEVLNIPTYVLMGTEKPNSELEIIGKIETTYDYPYIPNPVAAGFPTTIEGLRELPKINIPNYLLDKYAGSNNIIIMKVSGNSMNNVIPDGALIGVYNNYPTENLKDGDIVVFNSEYDYSLKHYYDAGDYLIFKPNSTDKTHKDIIIKKDQCLSIVGKVVMYSVVME